MIELYRIIPCRCCVEGGIGVVIYLSFSVWNAWHRVLSRHPSHIELRTCELRLHRTLLFIYVASLISIAQKFCVPILLSSSVGAVLQMITYIMSRHVFYRADARAIW